MVSGWPGPPSDSEFDRLPSEAARSATGTTFMIREPGVDVTFDYRHATLPDAGVRLNVTLGGWSRSRMHHIDSSGVFYSHESKWSADAGFLTTPLASLLGRGFWSMLPEQRAEAWPVILREDPDSATGVLWEGHDEPDYDGFLATLTEAQRKALLDSERATFEAWVDLEASPRPGMTKLDFVEMGFSRWVFSHPATEPEWFMPLASRAGPQRLPGLFDYGLALRGDREAADRLCADDGDSDESMAVFALTAHQCSTVVQRSETPNDLYGLWAHGGVPCTPDDALARARALMDPVLPTALRVDAGVEAKEGCGPFLAALAVQRTVPPGTRRRFERMHYQVIMLGAPCRDVRGKVLELPGTVNRKAYVAAEDPEWGPFTDCELVIDDKKRTVRVKGVAREREDAAEESP